MTTDPEHGELVPLGSGPVATVLAGVDAATGEAFALKVFPGRLDRRTRAGLENELTRLAALRTHAAVLVADRVEQRPDGRCALRMELCSQSLPELLDSFGPLSVADTLVLGTVLAAALTAAHSAGIAHGGVTPGNVLFRPSGEPVLSDFGLALRHAFPRDPLWTADFLPPETVRDGSADERSDLYGLGAILYLALSGRPPHQGVPGEAPGERLLRVLSTPVPPLDRAGVPPELAELVSALLAGDPDARPVAAATVAERLDALRVRFTPPDEPPPADEHATPGDQQPPPAGPQLPLGDAQPIPADSSPTPPDSPSTAPEERAFDDFAGAGAIGAERPGPEAQPPTPATEQPIPEAQQPPPAGERPVLVGERPAALGERPALVGEQPARHAEPASQAAPRPRGEPIVVYGGGRPRRRATRTHTVLALAGGLSLLTVLAVLLLLNRPGQLAVPPPPAQVELPSAATTPPKAVRLELADPADRGNFVELSWHSTEPLDFAVVVAAEGERAKVILAQRANTYRVPVDPVRRYCFLIQGTDGDQVYESQPKPIRGARCVK
ncbi:protein kinase [Actinomycetes bacterium KLBMP 9797]